MERLTDKHEADAQREEYKRRLVNGYPRNIPEERFLRLAAYEDTHMMPPDVMHMRMDMAILTALFDGIDVDRMREIVAAERDGRLVVLPCKVGDVVYGFYGEKTILPMVAKWIETNTDGWCIAAQYTPMAPMFYRFSDFGKTVFLTREEAEKALEGMRND